MRLVLAVVLATAACSRTPEEPTTPHTLVERTRVSMGTELRLTAWTADNEGAVRAFDRVFDEFDRLDRLLSVWHPDSDVSRVNAAAGRGPVEVDPVVIEAIETGRQVGEWTDGKFDITFGALSSLWKFDHDQDNVIPPRDAVRKGLPLVDFRAIAVDPVKHTVFLKRAGMRLHLGGIGKGLAVDRAAAILRAHGLNDFMIQSGGDLYVGGRRGDRPWRGGIKDPRADRLFAALNLQDETLSTSGDYERFFMRDGRRYHHILDPDSGEPARGCRSVTIVTSRAAVADALSTGIFVAGPDAGMQRLAGVEGVIVATDNRVLVSSGLRHRLELLSPPTDAP